MLNEWSDREPDPRDTHWEIVLLVIAVIALISGPLILLT